jgi:hypothetical protein
MKLAVRFELRDGDGNVVAPPQGANLFPIEVSRDLNAIARRVLNHENVGLFAMIELPPSTAKDS